MASVVRVNVQGALPGGEVWSVNPCFFLLGEPVTVSAAQCLTIATAIDALTISTGIRAAMSSSTTFTGTRVEARHRDGTLEAQGEHVRGAAITGSGSVFHPFQTASVTSLRTGFPGAQGRGRLYWPATGIIVTLATLRADTAAINSLLLGVKTYLAAISTAVAASAGANNLSVWSRTGSAFHQVTSMRQGDILDTQRRRRDTLAEAYQDVAYP